MDIWAPPIQGDADRLEQVLSNLLENAIKYSADGGTVRIELGRTHEAIVLAVRDEGIGLPPDGETIFSHSGGRRTPPLKPACRRRRLELPIG